MFVCTFNSSLTHNNRWSRRGHEKVLYFIKGRTHIAPIASFYWLSLSCHFCESVSIVIKVCSVHFAECSFTLTFSVNMSVRSLLVIHRFIIYSPPLRKAVIPIKTLDYVTARYIYILWIFWAVSILVFYTYINYFIYIYFLHIYLIVDYHNC